ncbi:hypothetical protein RintRC_5794 [Richelia intracellularis]|nr:hypothetical protein RintRC_5794 [Richelia intracellularis]
MPEQIRWRLRIQHCIFFAAIGGSIPVGVTEDSGLSNSKVMINEEVRLGLSYLRKPSYRLVG